MKKKYNKKIEEKKHHIVEIKPLEKSEIVFEDELLVERNSINAYVALYYIDIFEKFGLKERTGFEYNMYVDYYMNKNKTIITIIEKDESNYFTYEYETSYEENKMLKEKLNEYCMALYNQKLEDFWNEEKECENEL